MTSLQAIFIEQWQLAVNEASLRTVKVIDRDIEERVVKGWLEQSDHNIVNQKRQFYGLARHNPETGAERTGFSWYVGGGRTLTFSRLGRGPINTYVCTSDRIEIEDHITGSGWQHQQWEMQSKAVPVPGSYYEETLNEIPEE